MSKKSLLLQTAAMLAMADSGGLLTTPKVEKSTKNNGFNGKKCKSCASYRKGCVYCGYGNRNACSSYVKRKK